MKGIDSVADKSKKTDYAPIKVCNKTKSRFHFMGAWIFKFSCKQNIYTAVRYVTIAICKPELKQPNIFFEIYQF